MRYKEKKQYRLPDYDYSWEGGYFVTICTKDRKEDFGDVVNGSVKLSKVGEIAREFWLEIPVRFSNVVFEEWIIMPNHIHGIILITDGNRGNTTHGRNAPRRVPTTRKDQGCKT